MQPNLYLDVELIRDGTARWLWALRGENALYGAGVSMSRTDAQRAGEQALTDLGQKQHARRTVVRDQGAALDMLDLDALEAGADPDALAVRNQRKRDQEARHERGDGHTPDSDPAALGGI